jgi:hypothetical protein
MLPRLVREDLERQLAWRRQWHERDLARGLAQVELPGPLKRQYPRAAHLLRVVVRNKVPHPHLPRRTASASAAPRSAAERRRLKAHVGRALCWFSHLHDLIHNLV